MPRVQDGEFPSEFSPDGIATAEVLTSGGEAAPEDWSSETTFQPPAIQSQSMMISPEQAAAGGYQSAYPQSTNGFNRTERLAMQSQFDQSVSGDYQPAQQPAQYSADPNGSAQGYGYYPAPSWQFLPDGILYKSYLAGPKEPRFASAWLYQQGHGWIWDISLGARMGLVRYGTQGTVRPQGFQLDIEGAAFPRLDVEQAENLMSADFRFGVPLTWSAGQWQTKFGYYHISSHVGDEFLLDNPTFQRVNYVRDSIIFGVGYFATQNVRLYGETAWAFHHSVAEPWEFQFGAEYSPQIFNGRRGAPFAAINAQLLQEQDFGGGLNLMAGWQWRSEISNRLLRVGLQYYNGKSSQFAFYNESEQLLGFGVWLDQ